MKLDNFSAQEPRSDPLEACEVCRGRRLLETFGMTSLCAWCDGSGLQLSDEAHEALLRQAVSERLRTIEAETGEAG